MCGFAFPHTDHSGPDFQIICIAHISFIINGPMVNRCLENLDTKMRGNKKGEKIQYFNADVSKSGCHTRGQDGRVRAEARDLNYNQL